MTDSTVCMTLDSGVRSAHFLSRNSGRPMDANAQNIGIQLVIISY